MRDPEQIIQHELDQIELQQGIKILHAIESGSRVWGFASSDSDYDVRFIYVRPLAWYLSVFERRDVVGPFFLGGRLYDFSGWDMKKVLALLYAGNPPLMEWLSSPVVYRHDPAIEGLKALVPKYFNARSAIYHYLHMADGNFRMYLQTDRVRLKKYLYVVRPLLCCMFIEKHHMMPPVALDEILNLLDGEPAVKTAVLELVEAKRAGQELEDGPRIGVLNQWVIGKLAHFAANARTTARSKTRGDDLDALLFDVVTTS